MLEVVNGVVVLGTLSADLKSEDVVARAAVIVVTAIAAEQNVVPLPAVERIGVALAEEHVVAVSAVDGIETGAAGHVIVATLGQDGVVVRRAVNDIAFVGAGNVHVALSALCVGVPGAKGRFPRIVTCPGSPSIRYGGSLVNPDAL